MSLRLWIVAGMWVSVAAFAGAQAPEFLIPGTYEITAGQSITLAVRSAAPNDDLGPPAPGDLSRFFIRVAGMQDNREAMPGPMEPGRGPVLPLTEPGVTMLVADWKPVVLEIEPAAFREFLAARVPKIDPGTVPDGAAVRVRHVRSAKSILHVSARGGQPPDAATGTSKSGQLAEVRATFDPATTPVGADMPVRVYVRGDSESRVLVRALHASAPPEEFLTNAKGMGDFPLSAPGPWRVQFQWARALKDDPDADWEVFSGTLTFSTPRPAAGGKP
ncbi:MAG: hypothetical protein IT437_10430 [Phycisphaerales bacterium]|nr:hypothetical protein [Phycisphaerales bacterium]